MRMTIHMIPTEDAGWWLPLFEPAMERWSRRRLEQLGMPARSVEKSLRVIAKALEDGPVTRTEARDRVEETGIELRSQTDPQRSQMGQHIVGLAVLSGLAVLGPDRGAQSMLIRREDWLEKPPKFDREAALGELARVYLGAFAPATDRDFAYWSGLPLRDVRAGLERISEEIEQVDVGGEAMLVPRGSRPRLPARGQVRMLGNFDTYLLGWKDRGFSVDDEHALHVKEGGGGWIRPVIVEDGIVIGGWRSSRKGGLLEITLNLPKRERERLEAEIEREVADIERFEGIPCRAHD
jgi:hypothetical protein